MKTMRSVTKFDMSYRDRTTRNAKSPLLELYLKIAGHGMAGLLCILVLSTPVQAEVFQCASLSCLVFSIDAANANGQANIINLEQGTYVLTAGILTADGLTGLPSISSTLTINGTGSSTTIISRPPSAVPFRIFHLVTLDSNHTGRLSLNGLTIAGGVAMGPDGTQPLAWGGGILARSGTSVTLNDVFLVHNTARLGGGLKAESSGLSTINNSCICGNTALETGGGMHMGSGSWSLSNSLTEFNVGGGIFSGGGSVRSSTIAFNQGYGISAPTLGGLNVVNSTITSNIGNGIEGQGAFLINVTISNNVTGVFLMGQSLSIKGSLIVNNSSADCGGQGGSRTFSFGHNIDSDNTCNLSAMLDDHTVPNFGLGPLEFHGGPTPTRLPLLPSPAIDAIPPLDCSLADPDQFLTTDQRGVRRAPAPGGRCDIGAVELVTDP